MNGTSRPAYPVAIIVAGTFAVENYQNSADTYEAMLKDVEHPDEEDIKFDIERFSKVEPALGFLLLRDELHGKYRGTLMFTSGAYFEKAQSIAEEHLDIRVVMLARAPFPGHAILLDKKWVHPATFRHMIKPS